MSLIVAPVPTAQLESSARNFKFEYVHLADLKLDPSYHAKERFQESRALKYAANWDEAKAGVITVSERDGQLWLIDGAHRRFAAMRVGTNWLYAKVFMGLTRKQEAAVFLGLSDAVRLSPMDAWLARREEGDPLVLDIEKILDKHGARIVRSESVRGGSPRHTRAVASLMVIYRNDPVLLDQVIETLRKVWPEQRGSLDALPLQGLSSFLYCYRRTTRPPQQKKLEEHLAAITPQQLRRVYQTQREASLASMGGRVGGSIVGWSYQRRAVLATYNRKLQLPLPDLSLGDLKTINDGRIVKLPDPRGEVVGEGPEE